MNILFADDVTKTKSGVSGSIRADKAVARVNALDWQQIGDNLDKRGNALFQGVLSPDECQALAALYPEESIFRSHVVMGRHGFGRGEYKYFNYPLPDLIQGLRTALYGSHLSRIVGIRLWKLKFATRTATKSLLRDATTQDSSDQRRCSVSTAKAISTAFIRISTASTYSRSK
jgi:hypothetical protein